MSDNALTLILAGNYKCFFFQLILWCSTFVSAHMLVSLHCLRHIACGVLVISYTFNFARQCIFVNRFNIV